MLTLTTRCAHSKGPNRSRRPPKKALFGAGGSAPLKSSLVEEVARQLSDLGDGQNLVIDKPEILALIDVLTLTVELDIRSHYFYGRYRKLERGIPQTKWPCRACKGCGCEKCDQNWITIQVICPGTNRRPTF